MEHVASHPCGASDLLKVVWKICAALIYIYIYICKDQGKYFNSFGKI
jgi:hypothetical protein